MKNTLPHVAASLIMSDFADGLIRRPWKTLADAIAGKILEEWMRQRKARPGAKDERSQASQSRINAMAAGAACTNRILRLTVAAP
jgi:hypothetical protein